MQCLGGEAERSTGYHWMGRGAGIEQSVRKKACHANGDGQACRMIERSTVVSIHPYFKVKSGKMTEAKALLDQLISRTSAEKENLYYDFTIHEEVVFCREAYSGAAGLLHHLDNVGPVLGELLKLADLIRLEVHAAPEELSKLKGPLERLSPQWFEFYAGVNR